MGCSSNVPERSRGVCFWLEHLSWGRCLSQTPGHSASRAWCLFICIHIPCWCAFIAFPIRILVAQCAGLSTDRGLVVLESSCKQTAALRSSIFQYLLGRRFFAMYCGDLVRRKLFVVSGLQAECNGRHIASSQIEFLPQFPPSQFLIAHLIVSSPAHHSFEKVQKVHMSVSYFGFRFEIGATVCMVCAENLDELIVLRCVID